MNLTDPQRETIEAIARDDYRSDIKDINFADFAFDIAERHQRSDDEIDESEEVSDDESENEFDSSR